MRSALRKLNQHGVCLTSNLSTIISPNKLTGSNYIVLRGCSTRLAEVGKFEAKQPDENYYAAGQPFLHRVFGYRGVTLFPWIAKVYDNDLKNQCSDGTKNIGVESQKFHNSTTTTATTNGGEQVTEESETSNAIPSFKLNQQSTRFHPYYQVLIDFRDCPFVSSRTQTEAVTFLGHPDSSKSVCSIKGLDYVAHEDILPYTSLEERPIEHELYSRMFKLNPNISSGLRFDPTELLESWRSKHTWLDLSRVYRETTENVRVTVIPFYLGHTLVEDTSFYWWRYCVRLENFSGINTRLHERHWKIFSQTNMVQTIKGRGVVGVEPLLSRAEPAYQYSSHINLQDRSGHMWGTFKMQREDGHTFECRIPSFSLESSLDTTTPPTSKRTRDDSKFVKH